MYLNTRISLHVEPGAAKRIYVSKILSPYILVLSQLDTVFTRAINNPLRVRGAPPSGLCGLKHCAKINFKSLFDKVVVLLTFFGISVTVDTRFMVLVSNCYTPFGKRGQTKIPEE